MTSNDSTPHPRIFLSSTIRDMRDLRDALKFWLEEMGYDVQLSEHNDFGRRPDAGTFEACFESIRESDYYLLLIGERTGEMFDMDNRVSVTRQEYRVAYESWSSNQHPKILAFVRHDVMVRLRERKAAGVGDEPGSGLESPSLTSQFVDEVRRKDEADAAAKQGGDFPGANWLVEFSGFRELTDALRAALSIRGPLTKAAVMEDLKQELKRNLRHMMRKLNGKLAHYHGILTKVRQEVEITRDDLRGEVTLSFENLKHLVLYRPTHADNLLTDAVDYAIHSSALLEYDSAQDSLRPSSMLRALYELRDEIAVYRASYAGFSENYRTILVKWFEVKDARTSGSLPAMLVVEHFALNDTEQNVVRITTAILRDMYGHTDEIDYQPRPRSPVPGEDEEIRESTVSEEDIEEALLKDSIYLTLGSIDLTDEQRAAIDEQQEYVESLVGRDLWREYKERFEARFRSEKPETMEQIRNLNKGILVELGIIEDTQGEDTQGAAP